MGRTGTAVVSEVFGFLKVLSSSFGGFHSIYWMAEGRSVGGAATCAEGAAKVLHLQQK